MALERELATFNQKLPELKEHEGKYVLIHGDELVEIYSGYEDALNDGYKRFGLAPFLVKQVRAIEQVQFISRYADPCAVTGH